MSRPPLHGTRLRDRKIGFTDDQLRRAAKLLEGQERSLPSLVREAVDEYLAARAPQEDDDET